MSTESMPMMGASSVWSGTTDGMTRKQGDEIPLLFLEKRMKKYLRFSQESAIISITVIVTFSEKKKGGER